MQKTLDPDDQSTLADQHDGITPFLNAAITAGASSQKVAEDIAAAFRSIDLVLSPVIGQRGVSAIYKRTLHLAGRAYPWLLAGPQPGASSPMDVKGLSARLAMQEAAQAAAAGEELLRRFHELLIGLIGPALTERLLRRFWISRLSGAPALEKTPWLKK